MTSTNAPTGDPLVRAIAAWHRSGERDQPSSLSALTTHDGKQYVVLTNVSGPMAVYRVRTNGSLKRLKRWPAGVTEGFE